MKSRALTPFFRWLADRAGRPFAAGDQVFPSATAGNHAGEAGFLALAVFSLTATGVVPLTMGISPSLLRWPVMAVLLFLIPHVVMGVVSLLIPRMNSHPTRRVVLQDYGSLMAMTLYAGLRITGAGWETTVCWLWLGFAAFNLPFLLWEKCSSSCKRPPSPSTAS